MFASCLRIRNSVTQTMRLELDNGTHKREVEVKLNAFRTLYKQRAKDIKDCPPLPKKASKKSYDAQILEDCFRKLWYLDPLPQELLELIDGQLDEPTEYTKPLTEGGCSPDITLQPSEQPANFSLPLVQMESAANEADIVDTFRNIALINPHPKHWLQDHTFANDVVIHGVLEALGYTGPSS